MGAVAYIRYLRVSPRRSRAVARKIKGKQVSEALAILKFTPKKAARMLYKAVKSAADNAISRGEASDYSQLYIKRLMVNEGPRLRRWRPEARGRVKIIRHRYSHYFVEVERIGG